MNFLKIREYRKAAKIKQEELAKRLGVNRATVSKYETGVISPTIEQAQKIAEILGVSLAEIVGMDTVCADAGANASWNRIINSLATTNPTYSTEEFTKMHLWELLNEYFDKLNVDGMNTAVERIKELTEIPKYQK